MRPRPRIVVVAALAAIAGGLGSVAAVAGAGSGSYRVAALDVAFRATPSRHGFTRLVLEPEDAPVKTAFGDTHSSPVRFSLTIGHVSEQKLRREFARDGPSGFGAGSDLLAPPVVAGYLDRHWRKAIRAFAVRLALLSGAGGFAAAALAGLGRWKRVIATGLVGALAGTALMGVIGIRAVGTYDTREFRDVRFQTDMKR
jgi:hypothetical protein